MAKLRVGLMGAGRWAARHLLTLRDLEGVDVAWVGSRTRPAPEFPLGATRWVPCPERGLPGEPADVLALVTPPDSHGALLEAAMGAGLPTLVEKPLCLDALEARRLRAMHQRTGVPVMVGHTQLFQPGVEELRRRCPGEQVRFVHAEAGAFGPHRLPSVSPLWDWGCHDVSLALSVMDAPARNVHALQAEFPAGGRPAQMFALGFSAGHAGAWITTGNCLDRKRRALRVFGEQEMWMFEEHPDGCVLVRYLTSWDFPPVDTHALGEGERIPLDGQPPLRRQWQAFVAGVRAGEFTGFGLQHAVEVVEVLAAAELSLAASPVRAMERTK